MKPLRFLRPTSLPANFLSARIAVGLFVGELILGVTMLCYLEGYSVGDAFYMIVITMSTVGFGEIAPLSHAGRWFMSLFILINLGVFTYFLAVFSFYIVEGQIFKNMYENLLQRKIDQLDGHVILCGIGSYGAEIASSLQRENLSFVIIEQDEEKIQDLQRDDEEWHYLHGDATDDEVLLQAGIERASGLICALGEDSDNVFTVLSARQLNARLSIVSRCNQARSQGKLLKAGANHVIMPANIGGAYMAMLMARPLTVELVSLFNNEQNSDIIFEKLHYAALPGTEQGKSIRDLNIRRLTGANIIGYRTENDRIVVNPNPDFVLSPGEYFIVLGNQGQINRLYEEFPH
ncbi:MAG: potassium channel protein [Bacteroidota bacterium]